jgi:hypothetical protein
VSVREPPTLAGKPIDVGRTDVSGSVAARVAITKVVGVDENDVWSGDGVAKCEMWNVKCENEYEKG